jgi:bacteriorhodopsin
VLLPSIIYVVWLLMARRKARRNGATPLAWYEGPWLWTVVATMLMAIGCFMWLGLSATPEKRTYHPAHMKDGVLMPGGFEEPPAP